MKIQDIIEPARHLPFKIMITDPASKHAMEDVCNPLQWRDVPAAPLRC